MRIHSSPVVGVGSKRPLSRMAPACRGGNVSACAKFPEHAHFFRTVVLLIVIVGNSIRLASEVESDRARQRRVREACDLAPRAAQRFVAGHHRACGKSQRRCPDRYREPFSPISRLLDGGLRHTYAGREQSRGKGIGRGANSAVARPRRSWPTLGGAVWESGERREAEVP